MGLPFKVGNVGAVHKPPLACPAAAIGPPPNERPPESRWRPRSVVALFLGTVPRFPMQFATYMRRVFAPLSVQMRSSASLIDPPFAEPTSSFTDRTI